MLFVWRECLKESVSDKASCYWLKQKLPKIDQVQVPAGFSQTMLFYTSCQEESWYKKEASLL